MADDFDDIDFDDMDDYESDDWGNLFDDEPTPRDPPSSKREAVEYAVKDFGTGVKEGFSNVNLKQNLEALTKGLAPKALQEETAQIGKVKGLISEEANKLMEENKEKLNRLAGFVATKTSDGGILNRLAKGLQEKTEASQEYSESIEEIAKGAISDFIDDAKAEAEREELNVISSYRQEEATNRIYNVMLKQEAFSKSITSLYYRKSLEFQYIHLTTARQAMEVSKVGFSKLENALSYIVKNTALPDVVKMKSTEAMYAQARNTLVSDKVSNLFKEGGAVSRFKDKLLKGKDSASGAIDAADEMVEGIKMSEEMSDMMGSKSQMMGGQIPSMLLGFLGGQAGKIVGGTKVGRKFIDMTKGFTSDPAAALRDLSEGVGRSDNIYIDAIKKKYAQALGGVANLIGDDDEYRTIDGLSTASLTEAATMDKQLLITQKEVVPGLLSQILKEVTLIRTKKSPDEVDDVKFDFETRQFSSVGKQSTKLAGKISNVLSASRVGSGITGLAKFTLNSSGESYSPLEVGEAKTGITSYMLTGKSFNPTRLDEEFYSFFNNKTKALMMKGINNLVGEGNLDKGHNTAILKKAYNEAKSNIPKIDSIVNRQLELGNTDLLLKNKLIQMDVKTGKYELNTKEYDRRVLDSVKGYQGEGDELKAYEYNPEDNILDKFRKKKKATEEFASRVATNANMSDLYVRANSNIPTANMKFSMNKSGTNSLLERAATDVYKAGTIAKDKFVKNEYVQATANQAIKAKDELVKSIKSSEIYKEVIKYLPTDYKIEFNIDTMKDLKTYSKVIQKVRKVAKGSANEVDYAVRSTLLNVMKETGKLSELDYGAKLIQLDRDYEITANEVDSIDIDKHILSKENLTQTKEDIKATANKAKELSKQKLDDLKEKGGKVYDETKAKVVKQSTELVKHIKDTDLYKTVVSYLPKSYKLSFDKNTLKELSTYSKLIQRVRKSVKGKTNELDYKARTAILDLLLKESRITLSEYAIELSLVEEKYRSGIESVDAIDIDKNILSKDLIKDKVSDISDKAVSIGNTIKTKASNVVDSATLRDRVDNIKDAIVDTTINTKDKVSDIIDNIGKSVDNTISKGNTVQAVDAIDIDKNILSKDLIKDRVSDISDKAVSIGNTIKTKASNVVDSAKLQANYDKIKNLDTDGVVVELKSKLENVVNKVKGLTPEKASNILTESTNRILDSLKLPKKDNLSMEDSLVINGLLEETKDTNELKVGVISYLVKKGKLANDELKQIINSDKINAISSKSISEKFSNMADTLKGLPKGASNIVEQNVKKLLLNMGIKVDLRKIPKIEYTKIFSLVTATVDHRDLRDKIITRLVELGAIRPGDITKQVQKLAEIDKSVLMVEPEVSKQDTVAKEKIIEADKNITANKSEESKTIETATPIEKKKTILSNMTNRISNTVRDIPNKLKTKEISSILDTNAQIEIIKEAVTEANTVSGDVQKDRDEAFVKDLDKIQKESEKREDKRIESVVSNVLDKLGMGKKKIKHNDKDGDDIRDGSWMDIWRRKKSTPDTKVKKEVPPAKKAAKKSMLWKILSVVGIGMSLVGRYIFGLVKGVGTFIRLTKWLGKGIWKVVKGVWHIGKFIGGLLGKVIKGVFGLGGKIVRGVGKAIKGLASRIWSLGTRIVTGMGSLIKTVVTSIGKLGGKLLKGIGGALKGILGGKLFDGIKSTGSKIWNFGKKGVQAVGSTAGKAVSKIGAKGLLKGASKWIPGAGLAAGAYYAWDEIKKGNLGAAAYEAASGLVSLVPMVGGAISTGMDVMKDRVLGTNPDINKELYNGMNLQGMSLDKADEITLRHLRKEETGNPDGKYGMSGDIGDGAGISFGAYQMTEKSGNLKKFLQKLVQMTNDPMAQEFLNGFKGNWYTGNHTTLNNFLKKVGDTKAGRFLQDEMFKEIFLNPAKRLAAKYNVTHPAAISQVIDHSLNAGLGGAERMLKKANGDMSPQGIATARKVDYNDLTIRNPKLAKYIKTWTRRVDNNAKAFATLSPEALATKDPTKPVEVVDVTKDPQAEIAKAVTEGLKPGETTNPMNQTAVQVANQSPGLVPGVSDGQAYGQASTQPQTAGITPTPVSNDMNSYSPTPQSVSVPAPVINTDGLERIMNESVKHLTGINGNTTNMVARQMQIIAELSEIKKALTGKSVPPSPVKQTQNINQNLNTTMPNMMNLNKGMSVN